MIEHLFEVRQQIKELESVKDDIVAFHETSSHSGERVRSLWIADVKELYYSIVAAWELLSSVSDGNAENAEACLQFLTSAESHCRQVQSELKGLRSKKARALERRLMLTFEECRHRLAEIVHPFLPHREGAPPATAIVKAGDAEYHLLCSVCGEVSFVFRIGLTRFSRNECLVYEGITHAGGIDKKHAKTIFPLLDRNDPGAAHSFLVEHKLLDEGIDAYCPDCDAVYCRAHYHVSEEWDDGFYDCSTGTCPHGHHRIIDD